MQPATVLNSLKNRGVDDIFIICTDNLTGFSAAIEAVFPQTEIQNCIIHQLRNSSKYVSYKDLKALMADLKAVYAAIDEPSALDALDTLSDRWDKKYPKIAKSWRDNWPNLICPYSNGFTEGCNNTIKVIKRVAYGYRNFHNFRSRILLTFHAKRPSVS